ncbi:MAG: hypothetical protein M3Y41_08305 [Pseudomonadota bacterium]|nr:hypothetical protein [Pseudomonadota bacterium]
MKIVIGAVLLAGLAAVPAQAQRYSPLSGEKLMQLCTGRDRTMVEACSAYINGVSDTLVDYQKARPADGSKGPPLPAYICVPGTMSGVQLRNGIVAWARQHRDVLAKQASFTVVEALRDSFPCQQ